MFYTFAQNNSGGYYSGPEYLIIEASNADEANDIAKDNGVYFDGVYWGMDSPCCGDRWYPVDDSDAEDTPLIYRDSPDKYNSEIYYKSGEVVTYNK